jgi:hypothetical protein
LEVYQKIQNLAPGETESTENIRVVRGNISAEQALEYFRSGETIVAALLLGYYLENRLKAFTAETLGRTFPLLSEGLKEMEEGRLISQTRIGLFSGLMYLRNKAIHAPATVTEADFLDARKKLERLEEAVS